MDKRSAARIKLLSSMCIWGSIGLFVRNIPLPSSVIANCRGIIGLLFLLLVMGMKHLRFQWPAIRRNALYLGLSGLMLGFNWILLFEAYRFTTIAAATLCYYLAPMIVVALSPFVFGESLNGRKLLCVLAALLGMVLVSGVLGINPDLYEAAELDGATSSQMLWKITMPNLKTILLYTLITSMIGGLNMYDIPKLFNDGNPANSTMTTNVFIYKQAFSGSYLYARAAAASVIMFIIIAIFSAFVFMLFQDSDKKMEKAAKRAAKKAAKKEVG